MFGTMNLQSEDCRRQGEACPQKSPIVMRKKGGYFFNNFFRKTNHKGIHLLHFQCTISHLVVTINITDILWNLTNMWLLW
jgi:hypothetical protein